MPEIQKPVLEHYPTETRQNQEVAGGGIPDSSYIVNLVNARETSVDYDAVLAICRKRYFHPIPELLKMYRGSSQDRVVA